MIFEKESISSFVIQGLREILILALPFLTVGYLIGKM